MPQEYKDYYYWCPKCDIYVVWKGGFRPIQCPRCKTKLLPAFVIYVGKEVVYAT